MTNLSNIKRGIAEKLWTDTMADTQYSDGRDNTKWKELVKEGFIAYAVDALEKYEQAIKEEVVGNIGAELLRRQSHQAILDAYFYVANKELEKKDNEENN